MPRPNWYNDNANRAFPFQYGTAGVSVPDSPAAVTMNQLPDDFIVDCGFTIGPSADFNEDDDTAYYVYLERIYRAGSIIYFEFKSTGAEIYKYPLTFARTISDDDYSLEYLDSDHPSEIAGHSVSDSVGTACRMPFWSGYLVTGSMASIAARLADGASIVRTSTDSLIEPALVENLSNSIVNSFELANSDRTRATNSATCPAIEWSFETGLTYEGARCIQGDVKLKAGYNVKILSDSSTNTLKFVPLVGAGEGEPCGEVKVFPEETFPIDAINDLFEGGSLCNEVLRAINGKGNKDFKLVAGQGVSITPNATTNTIEINVNLLNMDLCEYSYTSEAL
jgi:hypothetical protein